MLSLRLKTSWMLLICGVPMTIQPACAADGGEIVAVSSRVSADYVRTRLPDGSFQAETYTFGQGGHWNGPLRDDSIDRLQFSAIARTISGPLADRNYLPATDPKQVKLLIMVYWGTSMGPGGASGSIAYQNLGSANQHLASATQDFKLTPSPVNSALKSEAQSEFDSAMTVVAMENRQRDKNDRQNAGILGYDSALAATDGLEFTALHILHEDLINELEDNRYFVVLMAYDFQLLWKEKKHKLVWETRFSIRERHNDFDRQLPAMVKFASRYFGEDTHGLLRKPLPEGKVHVGDLKVLDGKPEKN